MKKLAVILFAVFVVVLVASSCNQKPCPAYSKVDAEQADMNV